jgi:SnoaL-like polyketide cyclase
VARVVTPDVVGDWPGDAEPVRGVAEYTQRVAQVITRVPDICLEVAEHASNGEFIFIRWIARGTGANGPFELSRIDRIRLQDGLVKENIIRYDSALFEALVGVGGS